MPVNKSLSDLVMMVLLEPASEKIAEKCLQISDDEACVSAAVHVASRGCLK